MFVHKHAHLASLAAAAVLAGCAGGSLTPAASPASLAAAPANLPAVKSRLLYASNYSSNVVAIVAYPSGTPAGTLTGFTNPQGMCTDTAGHNVFIANTGGENVLEYAYGASSASKTYADPGEYPVSCSIDPVTGKLAIADIFSPTTGIGGVTVCTKPARCKTYQQPAGLTEVSDVAYTGIGDLYAGGIEASGPAVVYLPAGSSRWQPVSFSGSVAVAGGMQWDGKYLAIGDQSGTSGYTAIYRCKALGATLACDDRRVDLLGSDSVAFFIKYGDRGVLGIDNATNTVSTWPYPAGGNPTKMIALSTGTYSTWIGVVVLRAP